MGNHYNYEIINFPNFMDTYLTPNKQTNKNLKVTLVANYSVLAKSLFEENLQALNI